MRDLNELYFFAKVVDHGGFSAAAQQLGIPKSRLSRHIAQLEHRLGVTAAEPDHAAGDPDRVGKDLLPALPGRAGVGRCGG